MVPNEDYSPTFFGEYSKRLWKRWWWIAITIMLTVTSGILTAVKVGSRLPLVIVLVAAAVAFVIAQVLVAREIWIERNTARLERDEALSQRDDAIANRDTAKSSQSLSAAPDVTNFGSISGGANFLGSNISHVGQMFGSGPGPTPQLTPQGVLGFNLIQLRTQANLLWSKPDEIRDWHTEVAAVLDTATPQALKKTLKDAFPVPVPSEDSQMNTFLQTCLAAINRMLDELRK